MLHGEAKNESPFIRPAPIPQHHPLTKAEIEKAHRAAVVHWATWGILNHVHFTYTEGASRWHMVLSAPGTLPQYADCSAFATGCYKWAGLPDPNGLHYSGGYTGTLLKGMRHVSIGTCKPGDIIVYGPGTGLHAVVVLEKIGTSDFWIASHGHQGCPERTKHSYMEDYFAGHGHHEIAYLSSI